MKVSKWVDFGQEVEVEIGMEDIRAALGEAFHPITRDDRWIDGSQPTNGQVLYAFNSIGSFLRALTDEQIAQLKPEPREVIAQFLQEQAKRFGRIKP